MAASDTPTSYKDPYWSNLAGSVEAKLDLPPGLLAAIVTRGERTNADQVSEAGARTPFQIIPATRKAAIDKYGVDPYLSPENAAEVAGLLLKDSLKRNDGDARLAVAEYHGGTDRANWGPRTVSYVQRVTGGLPEPEPTAPAVVGRPPARGAMPDGSLSTFDRLQATGKGPSEPQIANVYAAYQSGAMSPEDAAQFEADVKAQRIMLPRGAALRAPEGDGAPAGAPAARNELPQGVVQAYATGEMSVPDRIALEKDVRAGLVSLPQGVELHDTQAPGFLARVREQITGTERSTPETDAAPDWAGMPELNSFSMASAKTGLGTLLSNPKETVQIIKANFPGVQVSQDAKGNYLLRSSVDGQTYAIKPGFQVSDVPRAAGAVAAFTPAGRATSIVGSAAAAAATQAAIEASQAATGGEFNPGDVAMAGAGGAAVPLAGRVLGAGADAAGAMLARARGVPQPAAAVREAAIAAPEAVAPAAAAPIAPAVPMAAPELVATAKAAAGGSKPAVQELAGQVAADAKTVAAAKRLGIEDYLQPDHVSTSQAYRELAQAVKSVPGSEARAAELQGLEKVGQRAEKLIDDLGGSLDASTVNAGVKTRMQAIQSELGQSAKQLYAKVRELVPAKTEATADSTLGFLRQHADEVGGAERLLPTERKLLSALEGDQPLTYAYLDQTRKQIGQAMRKATGPFADSESGLLKRLYGALSDDQLAVATAHGAADVYRAANAVVATRKALEDDLASLFGKTLDGSLVGSLGGAVKALPQGDPTKFVKLLSAVPEPMRQEVTATGLLSAFRSAATRGPINYSTYEKWYEGLLRNKQAHAALMSNLPPEARKQLSDLYRVAKGISAATRERISTGRIMAVQDQLKAAGSLTTRLYDMAKRGGVGAAAGTVVTPVLGPGVGAALASALTKGARPAADKAIDALIASPEFVAAARATGTPQQQAAVRALAYSKPFTRVVRALGQPREMSNRERWVQQALLSSNEGQSK